MITGSSLKNSLADNSEHSKFIINRFDHYFDSINNKGVFYITINTFLLGGFLSQTGLIIKSGGNSWWIYTFILLFISLNLISTILTILSINPFKSPKTEAPSSLIYYSDIACKNLDSFKSEYAVQTDEFMKEDLVNQIHQLAGGLKIKFDQMQYAGIFLLLDFLTLFPIIIVTIINLK